MLANIVFIYSKVGGGRRARRIIACKQHFLSSLLIINDNIHIFSLWRLRLFTIEFSMNFTELYTFAFMLFLFHNRLCYSGFSRIVWWIIKLSQLKPDNYRLFQVESIRSTIRRSTWAQYTQLISGNSTEKSLYQLPTPTFDSWEITAYLLTLLAILLCQVFAVLSIHTSSRDSPRLNCRFLSSHVLYSISFSAAQ